MLKILDIGLGNIGSVEKALKFLSYPYQIADKKDALKDAAKIIFPGVGNYSSASERLFQGGFVSAIKERVLERGTPILGICLGMQLLMTISEEFGVHRGLDVIPGRVVRFDPDTRLKVPHMGWNRVHYSGDNRLFEGIEDGSFFYFVHSYYVAPEDESVVCGWTDYGERFCSAIARGNLFATQFHPEKSHNHGLKVLENFGRIVRECT